MLTDLDAIRNKLIDRIMLTNNEQLLSAIDAIFKSTSSDEKVSLSSHQIEMLMMSDDDIESNNLISESDLNKDDSEWMD